jgi:16S rRNA (guanine966-N2)-methyltransferase
VGTDAGELVRVIGGKFRSRVLEAPAGTDTRPTADRLRETLFNVLTQGAADRVAGRRFLDLYAGSGAVGIEALSRGAASVTFVEKRAAALEVLRKNLEKLGILREVRVERRGVGAFLKAAGDVSGNVEERFDVVFLDPPYELAAEYESTLAALGGEGAGLLAAGAMVVAEHRRKDKLAASYGRLSRVRVKEQGDAGLSFYILDGGNSAD